MHGLVMQVLVMRGLVMQLGLVIQVLGISYVGVI